MNDTDQRLASRVLPVCIGLVLLLAGLALLAGGIKLVMVGGSAYYASAGAAFALDGVLFIAARSSALGLYGLILMASAVWSVYEAGFFGWALVPRLALWAVIGAILLLPWIRRPLAARRRRAGNGLATPTLAVAVLAVFGLAVGSQFTPDPGRLTGRIPAHRDHPVKPAYAAGADWPSYGGTDAGTHYSRLDQINTKNVGRLKVAWKIRTGDRPGDRPGAHDAAGGSDENTPLKVNHTLYVCTPHSKLLALDPETGRIRWRYNTQFSPQGAKNSPGRARMTCRGVAYQAASEPKQDGAAGVKPVADRNNTQNAPAAQACPRRIFLPTADARLIAINADTGQRCANFGHDGQIDLARHQRPLKPGGYYSTSPPVVADGLVIVGGRVIDNSATDEPAGVVRAYDARTGKQVWRWDAGNPTGANPHDTRNAPNVGAPMSVDLKRGLLYLPVGNARPGQFGGQRSAADKKYSASLVALHVKTGQVAWHRQLTHHDLWNLGPPAQPVLTDMATRHHGMQPVVIQPTKQGQLYVFNRVTGKPVVPIHERPAPQGAVAGVHTAPTQPHSALSLVPRRLTGADMWGVTPFDQLACRIRFHALRYDGPFTPPSRRGSISYPGNPGVMNWGGVAVDPADQSLFVAPTYLASVRRLVPREQAKRKEKAGSGNGGPQPNTGAPYAVKTGPFISPLGLPCQAPSWGDVAGIDLQKRRIAWRHASGAARDRPRILSLPLPVDVPALGGPIATAGGVAFETGALDDYVRAYAMATGRQLWRARLPAGGDATPMTYEAGGRQYLLVTAGGHGTSGTTAGDYVIAYRLATKG
ncbi:membrane-bound PQQ-dependent dehydrogenase, glucose/quinate/shikimate family [Salinisphaera sp. RV14]|uniref:membrane-bound PQQ-dependent dehydrogenase, glucose/quinate/shikimate family n=1 Tax=Salinisphaera sp. RV14 TaxID=3454140 RepID=UPI003F863A81